MPGDSQGAFTKLGINSTKLCYARLVDQSRYTFVDVGAETMCGVLDHEADLVEDGIKVFRFVLSTWLRPEEFDVFLPLMGFDESPADTFTIADDFESRTFTLTVDRVADIHAYTLCKVDKWIIRGQSGRLPLALEMHVIGTDETFPASFTPTPLNATAPYAFARGTFNILGQARRFDRFALVGDNHIQSSFYNSFTLSSATPADRTVILGFSTPYTTDETDIYQTLAGANRRDGASDAVLTFARGSQSTSWAFENLKAEAKPPDILGKTKILLDQYWKAYRDGENKLAIVTHVA